MLSLRTTLLFAAAALSLASVGCYGTVIETDLGPPGDGPDPRRVVQISGAAANTCARRADGGVVCWGSNFAGALGDGTLEDRDEPTAVIGIAGAAMVSAGEFSTCALLEDRTVRCWGRALEGQLGDGESEHPTCSENESCSTVPVEVSGLTDAVEISAGLNAAFARKAGGQVAGWGWNYGGQLGDGTGESHDAPVVLPGLDTSLRIYAGYTRSCAIDAGGALSCWGWFSTSPEEVYLAKDGEVEGLGEVVDVTGGWYHLCALARDGEVSCWGDNAWHQLGDGTTTERAEPSPVEGL